MTTSQTKPRKTLDQLRAEHAWQAVQSAVDKRGPHSGQNPKKFGGQAKKLPVRIMASGLGQALAFLAAKKYAPGLLAELSDWVAQRLPQSGGSPDLLARIIAGDSNFLRRVTDEVLAYLQWLNRFAEAADLVDED